LVLCVLCVCVRALIVCAAAGGVTEVVD